MIGEMIVVHPYSDCYFCGGEVKEQHIAREVWWKGKLSLIEDVPVGVCQQCGQKVILPDVAKAIDKMLAGEVPPDHFVQVPTYRFRNVSMILRQCCQEIRSRATGSFQGCVVAD